MRNRLLPHKRLLSTIVAIGALASLLMTGCEQVRVEEESFDPSKPIVLDSYSPHDGGVGTQMIIRGGNFGYDPSKVSVRISNDENREARIISAKGDRIYAIIPGRAGSGKVTVTIDDGEGNTQSGQFEDEFHYEFKENLSTFSGGNPGHVDGPLKDAKFVQPTRLALDDANDRLFVLEMGEKRIRLVDLASETVSTPWTGPGFRRICNVDFAMTTDTLIVGVEGGSQNVSTLYMLSSDGFVRSKNLTFIAGSNGTTVNPLDGTIFVQNFYEGTVLQYDRKFDVARVAAKPLMNNSDWSFCWSPDGLSLFALPMEFAGSHSVIVRMPYDPATKTLGEPVTWVGADRQNGYADGIGEEARIFAPWQMCCSKSGDYFLVDTWNQCIRRIVDNNGVATVSTYAGIPGKAGLSEGAPLEAMLNYPTGIAASDDGSTLYVADKDNHRLVKITVE